MNYYSDYEEEPKDGNSESKWEPTADMNIIKSVMSAVTEIMKPNGGIGRVSNASYRKQGDGQNMSAKMVISTNLWTIIWENSDSDNSKVCNLQFYPTEEQSEIERSSAWSTTSAELVKLFSPDGCA